MNHAVALVGDPVIGSVSPPMHRAAFAAAGLDWTYEAVTVGAGRLASAWPGLRERFRGLNVTTPHKEAVLPLLGAVTPRAARARSVNTVTFEGDRSEGESTDGAGFMAAVAHAGIGMVPRALVLGTGGAARAIVAVLAEGGTEVAVAGRNLEAGRKLARDLGARIVAMDPPSLAGAIGRADLLVNATPTGGAADPGACPVPVAVRLIPTVAVFDLVYRPRRTVLLERAAAAGCRTIEGIEMLIEQGARSFEAWTGLTAPIEVMRRAALAAVEEPVAVGRAR